VNIGGDGRTVKSTPFSVSITYGAERVPASSSSFMGNRYTTLSTTPLVFYTTPIQQDSAWLGGALSQGRI
jgi:hypothetical protein